jgi:heat shock protein HslJ
MEPENKLARDLMIVMAMMLAGGLFLVSGFGFQQRWTLERFDGVAAPPATIAFREPRRGRNRVSVVTACDAYEARYSRFMGGLTIDDLRHYPRACAEDDRVLLDALGQARRYHYEGEKLLLETADGHTLVLKHAPSRL